MKTLKINLLFSLFLLIIFFIFFMLSIPYYSGDVRNHIFWGRSILEEGSQGFYSRDMQGWSYPNYPPISMMSFAASVWFYDFVKSSIYNLNSYSFFPSNIVPWIEARNVEIAFLKIPALIPFVASGWFIFLFSRLFKNSIKKSFAFTLIFLFNPGLMYLSILWGQNDFAQVFFILGAFYLILSEKFIISYIFAALAILSKQTVLMIWGIFLISVFKLHGLSKSILALITSAIVLWLAYLPFNVTGPFWPFTYYNETLKSTGFLVADNAINYWGSFSNFQQADAGETLYFLTYERWGFLFFAILFLPLLIKYLKTKFSYELLFNFLYLSSISYFFALTRMHERYLFFGVIFAHLLFMVKPKYWLNLVFFSILYFLNLYRGLYQPDIPFLVDLLRNSLFLNGLLTCYILILIYNYIDFMFKLKSPHNETK